MRPRDATVGGRPARWLVDATALRPATLTPPPSKSDAQRALALAHAIGDPSSVELGADDDEALPDDVNVLRRGLDVLRTEPQRDLLVDCHDGGAPFRILVGQAAVTPGARVRFTGSARLAERPHQPLFQSLRAALAPAGLVLDEGAPWPLVVQGAGRASDPHFVISASDSSQFATSLLMAAAAQVVRERRAWTVDLRGPTASRGYLDLTLEWLARMGFLTSTEGDRIRLSDRRAVSTTPQVPGDWSSLGYLLLAAWKTGGDVARVDVKAAHPDRAFVRIVEAAGLALEEMPGGGVALKGQLCAGVRASGSECPDLLPTLAALACVAPAPSTFTEVSILRHKESDRLEGICELVRAAGGTVVLDEDALTLTPGRVPEHFVLSSRGDHRLAMSAATLAVLSAATLELEGPACVTKSFPTFWREMARVGVRVVG